MVRVSEETNVTGPYCLQVSAPDPLQEPTTEVSNFKPNGHIRVQFSLVLSRSRMI